MRIYILSAGTMLALAVTTSAQQPAPFVSKPIDTNRWIVQPGDAASAVTAGATTSTFRTITRGIAGAIEGNGFVKTVNNLLGRRAKPDPVQAGFSPLPMAQSYQSTRYPNSFTPQVPIAQAFGKSAPILGPTGPSAQR